MSELYVIGIFGIAETWRFIYWLSFVLAWIVRFPLLLLKQIDLHLEKKRSALLLKNTTLQGEKRERKKVYKIHSPSHFTFTRKLMDAIKANLKVYIIIGVILAIGIGILAATKV